MNQQFQYLHDIHHMIEDEWDACLPHSYVESFVSKGDKHWILKYSKYVDEIYSHEELVLMSYELLN